MAIMNRGAQHRGNNERGDVRETEYCQRIKRKKWYRV